MDCENCHRLATKVDTLLTKLDNIRRWVKEKFDEEIPEYFSFNEIPAKIHPEDELEEEGPEFPTSKRNEDIQDGGKLEDSSVKIEPVTPQPESDPETDYEGQDDDDLNSGENSDYQPEGAQVDSSNSSSEPMDSESNDAPKPNPIAKSCRESRLDSRKKKSVQNEQVPRKRRGKNDIQQLGPFKCSHPGCEKEYKTQKSLDYHEKYSIKHDLNDNPLKKQIFRCEHCSKPYTKRSGLSLHIKRCLSIKDVICQYCSVGFCTTQELQNHINAKHLKIRDFKCSHCNASFYLKHTLNYHLKSKHPQPGDSTQKLICAICGAILKTEYCLQSHIRLQHEGKPKQQLKRRSSLEVNERPFACDWSGCGKSFKSKSNLNIHIKSVHEKIDPKEAKKDLYAFKCNVPGCDASYIRIHQYNKHMESHKDLLNTTIESSSNADLPIFGELASGSGVSTSQDPGSIPNSSKMDCPICGKTLKNFQMLKFHIERVHHNKGSFICTICGKTIKSKMNLGYHMMKLHPEAFNPEDYPPSVMTFATPKEETFHCEICGYISRFRSAFNVHMQTHVEGGFKCDKCGVVLRTKPNLIQHNRNVHLRIKNFVCSIEGCGKAFASKWTLKDHERSHAGLPRKKPAIPYKRKRKQKN